MSRNRLWQALPLAGMLGLSGFLFLWQLNRNGLGNSYYSAAVIAATHSWKALFFGSFDAGNFITVDKPPLALWVMALSVKLFGLSSWSILVPEALAGVATVAMVYYLVRNSFGHVAGLIAGLTMALTPVAIVMFRYNNPDAMLTLLLVLSAWALLQAVASGRTVWLLLSALFVGLGFTTKFLQAEMVVPALALTFLVAAPGNIWRRVRQLFVAAVALIVASGWWMAVVDLIPAAARPFIGGSSNNSVMSLAFGYNGLGRITGAGERGPGGGFAGRPRVGVDGLTSLLQALNPAGATAGIGPGGPGFSGNPGLFRLFNVDMGGQISWLFPLALLALAGGLWLRRKAPRTDPGRAGYLLWGTWLAVHFIVFSFASGIIHAYYTVAMAPALAALVGAGLVDLWALRKRSWVGAAFLAIGLVGTAWWGRQMLLRTPSFVPWLAPLEVAVAITAAILILAPRREGVWQRLAPAGLAVGLAAILAGPASYAAYSVVRAAGTTPIPSAGPTVAGVGRFPGGTPPGALGLRGDGAAAQARRDDGAGLARPLPPVDGAGAGFPGAALGPPPGIGPGVAPANSALLSYLTAHQGQATWLVATRSAMEAAPIEIATGKAVMAMGGFSGGDQALTVDRLADLAASGQLRYVLLLGNGGGPGVGGSAQAAITQWVLQNGARVDYGNGQQGAGLYDLAATGQTGAA